MLAEEIGGADVVKIDLARGDLGLPGAASYNIVVALLKDLSLNSLRYAQSKGVPYIACSDAVFELAPTVALYAQKPASSPILLLGHWLGGTSTLAVLHFASEFRTIDAIEIGVVFDPEDPSGPVAYADMERVMTIAQSSLILKDGVWHWASGDEATRSFIGADGSKRDGQAASLLDVPSIAAATGAKSVRMDHVVAPTASSLRGEAPSHEVIVEIVGERHDGSKGRSRYEFVDPDGLATMSGRGIALCIERLLGLAGGARVAVGLYTPETLLDPAYVVARMKEFGTKFTGANT